MVDTINIDFLRTPTELEYGTGKVHEIMPSTIRAMNNILSRFPTLTREVLDKIYSQWYELDQLEIDGEIVMFDQFCEATKAILAHPIDISDTKGFYHMVNFLKTLDELQNPSQILQQFQRYLPHVPQETIDTARDVWKKKILSGSFLYSEDPRLFFPETDTEGYYPDLDHLKFFYERATNDSMIDGWYERFGEYCLAQ